MKKIWVRKMEGLDDDGYWNDFHGGEWDLTPVVDSTDHFTFACKKGHQMILYAVRMEPTIPTEPDAGPCFHLFFFCKTCDVVGERKIYADGEVNFPSGSWRREG